MSSGEECLHSTSISCTRQSETLGSLRPLIGVQRQSAGAEKPELSPAAALEKEGNRVTNWG